MNSHMYEVQICFFPVDMSYVSLIIRPPEEPGMVEEIFFFSNKRSACDWKQGLCRYNQIKIGSYWIRENSNPMMGVLITRGKFRHRDTDARGKGHVKRGNNWSNAATSKGILLGAGDHRS